MFGDAGVGTSIAELTKWQRSLVEYSGGYLRKVALPECGPQDDPPVLLAMVNSAGTMSIVAIEEPIEEPIESGGLEVSPAAQLAIRAACAEHRPIIAGLLIMAWWLYQPQNGTTPEALDFRRYVSRVYAHPDRKEVVHLFMLDPTGVPIVVSAYWEVERDGVHPPLLGKRMIIAEGVDRNGNTVETKGFVPGFLANAIADGLAGGSTWSELK
jgi:hypothetical protein